MLRKLKLFHDSGLFRRIFLHSLLLIVLVFVGMGVLFHLFGPQHTALKVINQLSLTITDQIDFTPDNPGELNAFLAELHEKTDMSFALFGRDKTMYARAGRQELQPLAAHEVDTLFADRNATYIRRGVYAFPLGSKKNRPDAYLLVKFKATRHHLWLLSSLAVVFFVVALVSVPLSRTIAHPIERLTRAATRFAGGDLTTPTNVDANNEIGILARHMDDMAYQLCDRIRAEKELLANVSHELKSPLARLKVALALCREDDSVTIPQLQQHLAGIEGDVGELEHLIEDVMAVARYDLSETDGNRSGFQLRRKSVHPGEIVAASRERFETMAPSRNLTVALDPNLKVLNVDSALIKRVIDNLLDNAAKYSPEQSTIELSISQTSTDTLIKVSDNGIGICKDDLPMVFEPFFRTDRSRDRGTGGTGLGLTLCKRIAEAHGGTIAAQSDGENGATFTVMLPM